MQPVKKSRDLILVEIKANLSGTVGAGSDIQPVVEVDECQQVNCHMQQPTYQEDSAACTLLLFHFRVTDLLGAEPTACFVQAC